MLFRSDGIFWSLPRCPIRPILGMEVVRRGFRSQSVVAALTFACLLAAMGVGAQEVVVFKDKRAEVVAGHRVDGSWTFLIIRGGEIGVPSDQIQEIRKATEEEVQSNLPAKAQAESASPPDTKEGEGSPSAKSPQPKQPKMTLRNLAVNPSKGGKGGNKQVEGLESKKMQPSEVKKVN